MNGEKGIDSQPADTTAAKNKATYLFIAEC
jgi:hypothetical protein